MNTPARNLWIGVAVLAVLVVAGLVYMYVHHPVAQPTPATTNVSYSCGQGTITAAYATSTVALVLSDGRSLNLPQVRSGSGIRYEDMINGAHVTFQSKGNDAFLEENGSVTFSNCVAGTTTSTTGTPTFTDGSKTFSFVYPSPLTVSGGGPGYSTDWMTNATAPGLVLARVTLAKEFDPSTNFSEAKLTVGTSADSSAVKTCLTYNPSGASAIAPTTTTINGTQYTVLHSSDAGAGNFYNTTSYRTLRDSQCYVIEYTIHTTNINNYASDSGISSYHQSKITTLLETVVQSFKFLNAPEAVAPAPTPTPSPTPTPQSYTVTNDSANTTLHLKVGDSFLVNLGDSLNWSVNFDPAGIVALRKGVMVIKGAQGLYNATTNGITKLTATGAPICNPGEACPQFLRYFTMSIVVGS